MPETSVRLDGLPPGVAIPNHLQTRYDPQNRLLIISDVMSDQELRELFALSGDNAYRDAAEALYWKSRMERLREELIRRVGDNGFRPEDVIYRQGLPFGKVVYSLDFSDVQEKTRYRSDHLNADNAWVRQCGDKHYGLDASLRCE